jgi:uncharacterized membrane protein YedE/YeeE
MPDLYAAVLVTPWPWWAAGAAIGLVVTLLAWLAGKPLGVSTAYGSACALASRSAFFRAREYHEPWRLAFIVGLPLGGLAAGALAGTFTPTLAYGQLDVLLGGSLAGKAVLLFAGGVLVGAGARWAGGCPSGHTIVGIAQGAVASVVATVGFMIGGLVVYNLLVVVAGGQ